MLSIKYKRLILFDQPEFNPLKKDEITKRFLEVVQPKAYQEGTVSKGAAQRLQRAIELLIDISPSQSVLNPNTQRCINFKVNFFTLTLSDKQFHEDKYIVKNMLEKMLRWMRSVHHVESYIWKAERQKNGNLHFHITSNVYINYLHLRDKWNQIQTENGYTDKYFAQHGHRDPNSTDVHSVRMVHDLARYLVKYVCKKGLKVDCKSWDCSKNLKRKDSVKMVADGMVTAELDQLYDNPLVEVIRTEKCWIVFAKKTDIRKLMPVRWKKQYYKFLNEVAGKDLYKFEPEPEVYKQQNIFQKAEIKLRDYHTTEIKTRVTQSLLNFTGETDN